MTTAIAAPARFTQLALFTDEDRPPMVTINVSLTTTRRVPRDMYEFPTGECPLENAWTVDEATAKHYSVRLIEHGPFMASVQACQWGAHTRCRNGEHDKCPFQPGRTHEAGDAHPVAGDLVTHKDQHGYFRPIHDETGRALLVLPVHVWHCSCECHPVDMLTEIAAADQ